MFQNIAIESILKDFYNISRIRISIHDTEFNEIYSYPGESTSFCRCLQQYGEVKANCIKSDSVAFNKVKASGEVYVYKCRLGLIEAVAPIYHFGTLAGYIMMGQFREKNDTSLSFITENAKHVLKDNELAEELCKSVKAIDRSLIDSYINIMQVLAEYLTSTNRLFTHNEKLPTLIKEYLNQNYKSKITLFDISQKFGCCNATLTKTFKKEYGISIMTYLTKIRLKKAEEMLIKTRKSIKEISGDCGFYDQNYFSKAFTKEYGTSPKEHRIKKALN